MPKSRQPIFFRGRTHGNDIGPRYDRLSKADWANAFCSLWLQTKGLSYIQDENTEALIMKHAEEFARAARR